jgi:CheY-like chemotaxis protein
VVEQAATASDDLCEYTRQFDDGTIAPRLTARVRLWNSEELTVEISNSFIPSRSRRKWLLSIFRDLRERIELEQQVRQAQKMKAIGQLAGGVAHDFNNILAAIRGNVDLALMDAALMPARTVEHLQQAISAADRAGSLVSQLMAFGRKQIIEPPAEVQVRGGNETILVVEDAESVRAPISCALRDYGYQVLEAGSARAALELWRTAGAQIDLLLADIVMPGGMTGSELAERLSQERPGLKVILMSGYGADTLDRTESSGNAGSFPVLGKPFRLQVMLWAVRENLDLKG